MTIAMGAHDREDDPATVLRVLRHTVTGLTVTAAIVSMALGGLGITQGVMELWNLGCTMLILSAGGGIAITALYCAELGQHGIKKTREEVHENTTRLDALERRDRQNSIRLDAIEIGERAIADAIRSDDDGEDDELGRRRRG